MLRVVSYWLFCLLTITLMLVCWDIYSGPPRKFIIIYRDLYFRYGPALVASLLLLPLVMVDVVRFSNRFAGPIVRLRGAMRQFASGRPMEPVHFRDGDLWSELAVDFNRVMERAQDLDEARDSAPSDLARTTA